MHAGSHLCRWAWPEIHSVFGLMLFGALIPFQMMLLPMARTLGLLGLAGSVWGLALVHTVYGIAFTTLFFRNVQAAKVDGVIIRRGTQRPGANVFGFERAVDWSSRPGPTPCSSSPSAEPRRPAGSTQSAGRPPTLCFPSRSMWTGPSASTPAPASACADDGAAHRPRRRHRRHQCSLRHRPACQSRTKMGPLPGVIPGHGRRFGVRLGARGPHMPDVCQGALAEGQFMWAVDRGGQVLAFRL